MTLSAGCYAAGYLTGLAAFAWMARRRGLATEGIFALLVAGIIGGLLCANVAQWLTTGTAGKTVLGGIAGGYLAVALAKRWLGIRRPTGDLFAVAICAGEAVGRWGCFFGGCCYGKPTGIAWAVWQHGAYRHPTQLYLSLSCLLILIVLILLEARRNQPLPENALFCAQGSLVLHSAVRRGILARPSRCRHDYRCAVGMYRGRDFLFGSPAPLAARRTSDGQFRAFLTRQSRAVPCVHEPDEPFYCALPEEEPT